MAKILNLDKLAVESDRTLVLKGKSYPVTEMSVANFIETTRTVQKLSQGESNVADQIEATVQMIVRCVPTVDVTDLNGMGLSQLSIVASFVRGDDVNEQEAVEAAAEQGK